MMPWRAAALKAMTFCMTVSRWHRSCGASLPEVLMSQGFRTSARKEKNGFVHGENCFVAAFATKHTRRNCEYFQCVENAFISAGQKFRPRQIGSSSSLVAGRRKQIAAAADGADHGG